MNASNYQEALDYLYSLTKSGIKLGLNNTSRLLKHFDNPQLNIPTIHIAGTNGKGSTAAITESILRASGLKVGLYTSPHILDFRERIQIDRSMIEKQQITELIYRVKSAVEKLKTPVTFFEFGTVLAFLYFHEQNTDMNVIEVGLGGRLDATNLCKAEISIITSISRDHTQFLGEDLEQITFEKASIIKESGTVFADIGNDELFQIVNELALKNSAELYRLGVDFQVTPEAKENEIPYVKGEFPWAASGRAIGIGRDEGFTKLLFDSETKRVIGAGIVGVHAGDLISEAVLALEMGADAEDLGLTIHPHPTLSETINFAAEIEHGTITDLYVPKRK